MLLASQGGGRPRPSISWLHDDVAVAAEDRRLVRADGGEFLIVLDVRPEDAGSYSCLLSNAFGKRRHTLHLAVQHGQYNCSTVSVLQLLLFALQCIRQAPPHAPPSRAARSVYCSTVSILQHRQYIAAWSVYCSTVSTIAARSV